MYLRFQVMFHPIFKALRSMVGDFRIVDRFYRAAGSGALLSLRSAYFSSFNRREPSRSGCQPNTSETMKESMRRSSEELSLMVDL